MIHKFYINYIIITIIVMLYIQVKLLYNIFNNAELFSSLNQDHLKVVQKITNKYKLPWYINTLQFKHLFSQFSSKNKVAEMW